MILIFGGTTEGRICAQTCEEAHKKYFYSTKTAHQDIELVHGIHLTGGMNAQEMIDFCLENKIRLFINAAHPFACQLHNNIAYASQILEIPTLRYERKFPTRDPELIWLSSYSDACIYLEEHKMYRLLALTGVNTILPLKNYWTKYTTWFRILNRADSRALASSAGFPAHQLLYYQQGEDEEKLFKLLKPQAILTKESGESGGFHAKVSAAKKLGIPLLVIKRPVLSSTFIPIYGPYGLHKEIERYVSGFFNLRMGYTTGSCATAASKAALIALITGEKLDQVHITLPSGELINIPIHSVANKANESCACVIKDAGDDPDVTHGTEIIATVSFSTAFEGVRFLPGEGVGRITLPGLDLPIGDPAINRVPREMMRQEVFKVLRHYADLCPKGLQSGVAIKISVPAGVELAKRTFNPRLGIIGGISIIGTSGVVKPFSSEAFIGAIRREIQVSRALRCEHLVINSGAKSEKYLKAFYPDFKPNAFIHYGNFIGETIRIAYTEGYRQLSMGIMLGKAVKLAEGHLDTHSKKVVMDTQFLQRIALESGCNATILAQIEKLTMARQLWKIIPNENRSFFQIILEKCYQVCSPLFPNGRLTLILLTDTGEISNKIETP